MQSEKQKKKRSSSESSSDVDNEQFNRLYSKLLKKKEGNGIESEQLNNKAIEDGKTKKVNYVYHHDRQRSRSRDKYQGRKKWHIYEQKSQINLENRFPRNILHLPILEKKDEIVDKIMKNQFVLVTGETGCGKSTQVPRLLYEYLRATESEGKILCVQPRRLAVLNLQHILQSQMCEKGLVGYQIAMQTNISPQTKILFMTNGIFLQRLVHSTDIFETYPFIVLDEVHQRDIDTDFILLAIKRVARTYPKLRVILMSATIDNDLFRYYFADDHIDKFMTEQNFYRKIIKLTAFGKEQNQIQEQQSESENEDKLYDRLGYQFMKSKYPCPSVNVTQAGRFTRQIFTLDTLDGFLRKPYNMRWGTVIFSQKYPNTHRELFEIVSMIIEQVMFRCPADKDKSNQSVLIFLPGLMEIQNLSESIQLYIGRQKAEKLFEIIQVHSSILNEEVTKKLHSPIKDKIKLILSTNIAESSITVMGVKYVIDFCLSKEVRFDQRSRMENLELIWASKASCKQRAGRTGRVCDGIVIRLLEQVFYKKLPEYSTPEIQRSSLDRLILRIKMIHENQKSEIFSDPGQVLGTAIQPPNLKNIDEAIKSLLFCGGLKMSNDQLVLTNLGRLYIDLPIDISYSKMVIMSILMGTFDDILILVSLLSQNKNAFKRFNIQKNYLEYFKFIDNEHRCDFMSLIKAYKSKDQQRRSSYQKYKRNQIKRDTVFEFDIYHETKQLIQDLLRRIQKRNLLKDYKSSQNLPDYYIKFKYTLLGGFLNKIILVRQPIYDDKQQKRARKMRNDNIQVNNTLTLINSQVIRKNSSDNIVGDEKLIGLWKEHISKNIDIDKKSFNITLTLGLAYIHFKEERYLNRLIFTKHMEDNRKLSSESHRVESEAQSQYISIPMMLRCLGDIDHMQSGTMFTLQKDQRITIDNYSQNRVVSVNQGQKKRFLITNTVMQQSSRLFCRYTSMLPDIPNLELIAHLVFYPFVILTSDKKNKRYEYLVLKRKNKMKIQYQLTQQEVLQVNRIRKIIKDFLDLKNQDNAMEEEVKQLMQNGKQKPTWNLCNQFWHLLKNYINKPRQIVVDENKWHQYFFKECNIEISDLADKNAKIQKQQIQEEKQFMNQIKMIDLKQSYFSSQSVSETVYRDRMQVYNAWKVKKLKQLKELKEKATNRNAYICCGICGVTLAPLKSVGSPQNTYYRQIYGDGEIGGNIKQFPFNQMGQNFCSYLMSMAIEKQYKVYTCINEHYLALKFEGERNIKITKFSELQILYPDGTIEKASFDMLDIGKWIEKNNNAVKRKEKNKISANCFICDQNFESYKELQTHFKDSYHEDNLKDFTQGMKNIRYSKQEEQDGY